MRRTHAKMMAQRRIHRRVRLGFGALAEFSRQMDFLAAAIDRQSNGVAGAFTVQQDVEVEGARYFLPIDRNDEIAADGDALHAGTPHAVTAWNATPSSRFAPLFAFHQQALRHLTLP